eukprot:55596-Eustigmatos_ZCMA.PRE.1
MFFLSLSSSVSSSNNSQQGARRIRIRFTALITSFSPRSRYPHRSHHFTGCYSWDNVLLQTYMDSGVPSVDISS